MHLLQMSIQGGVLIAAASLLRAFALHRLSKTTFLLLWGAALFRLLLPFSMPLPRNIAAISEQALPAVPSIFMEIPLGGGSALQAVRVQRTGVPAAAVIWLAGALGLLLFFSIRHLRSVRVLRTALPLEQDAFCSDWLRSHKTLRPVALLRSDRILSPVATGLLRPRIILPSTLDTANTRLVEHILLHEYCHIRRLDTLWKSLLVLALCLHWFNPLAWVLFALANRDLELSCDQRAVRHMAQRERAAYARSLLSMAERVGLSPIDSSFGSHPVEERVTAVMRYRRPSVCAVLVSAAVVSASAVFFISPLRGEAASGYARESGPIPSAEESAISPRGRVAAPHLVPPADPEDLSPRFPQESDSLTLVPPLAQMPAQILFAQKAGLDWLGLSIPCPDASEVHAAARGTVVAVRELHGLRLPHPH